MSVAVKFSKLFLVALTAVFLAACGGGGGDAPAASAAAPVAVAGSATGTLSDAPVGGVGYSTSSGVTGTTAADGSYQFNPGDSVTFKLGGLTLGTVTATGIVSPMELSGGSDVKLQNLLVLLQSLDSDGNPANGITIPSGAANAVTASVNLAGSTASFAADAGVQAAMTAGGVAGAPKTNYSARAHFISQGLALLSSNIWVSQTTDSGNRTHTVVLNIDSTGRYLQAETGTGETGASSGSEWGTLTVASFTAAGFSVTPQIGFDGNGEWGASMLQDCDHFRSVGTQLITSDCESSRGLFSKMDNVAGGIVGGWKGSNGTSTFETYFFANGTFLLANYGSSSASATDGNFTAAGGVLTFKPFGSGSTLPYNYTMAADGNTLTLVLPTQNTAADGSQSNSIVFTRISR